MYQSKCFVGEPVGQLSAASPNSHPLFVGASVFFFVGDAVAMQFPEGTHGMESQHSVMSRKLSSQALLRPPQGLPGSFTQSITHWPFFLSTYQSGGDVVGDDVGSGVGVGPGVGFGVGRLRGLRVRDGLGVGIWVGKGVGQVSITSQT